MTIGSNTARQSYVCNGSTTLFAIDIQAYLASDFLVIYTSLTGVATVLILNSDYTLAPSGTLSPTYWNLTTQSAQFVSPYVSGALQIILNPPQVQQTGYPPSQAFSSAAVQQSFDRGAQLSIRLQDQTNRTMRAPDSDFGPGMLLPPAQQRAMTYPAFDINGNLIAVTNLPIGTALTPAGLGAVLYPQTQGEINAGATIVNPVVRPGNPLRYATNAVPGITPMDTAFNFAVASLLGTPAQPGPGGEVLIDLAGGPYNLTAGINCTWAGNSDTPPVVVRFLGSAHFQDVGCILNHSTIGFDCTGNSTISFIDPCLSTIAAPAPTIFPQVGILLARNNAGGGVVNRIIRPKMGGYFSVANIYDYGAEQCFIEAPFLTNYGAAGAGNCCMAFTGSNYAGVQSLVPGLIATGTPSMTVITVIAANYTMNNPNATSDCVHLEGCSSYRDAGGWGYNPNGRACFFVDNSHGSPSQFGSITDFTMEHVGTGSQPGYGIYFGPAATPVTHIGWNTRGLRCDTNTFAIAAADANTTLNGWTCDPISEEQSHGINLPGALTGFSSLRLGGTVVNIGSVAQGCLIIGDLANITIGGGANEGTIFANTQEQIAGFGTPTGGVVIPNFPGGSATLQQCSQSIALIFQIMKLQGSIAS
jgi:hypothetical protein